MGSVEDIKHAATILSQLQCDGQHFDICRKELEQAFNNLKKLLGPVFPESTIEATATYQEIYCIDELNNRPSCEKTASEANIDEQVPSEANIDEQATNEANVDEQVSSEASIDEQVPSEANIDEQATSEGDVGEQAIGQANGEPNERETTWEDISEVRYILDRLETTKNAIKGFFALPPCVSLSQGLDYTTQDPRVVYPGIVKGKRTSADFLRSLLSELSLADDFTKWQAKVVGETRISSIIEDLSASQQKNGNIRTWIGTIVCKEPEDAIKLTEYGIKWRVLEGLYSRKSNGSASGLPGIFSLLSSRVLRLKYKNLPYLVDGILSSDWAEFVQEKDSWMKVCLDHFNNDVQNINADLQRRKRQRLDYISPFPRRPPSPPYVLPTLSGPAPSPDIFNFGQNEHTDTAFLPDLNPIQPITDVENALHDFFQSVP